MDPATLAAITAGGQAVQGYGAIRQANAQNELNDEVRKQNRFGKRVTGLQNSLNLQEYFANQPLDRKAREIELAMKRKSLLDQLMMQGVR